MRPRQWLDLTPKGRDEDGLPSTWRSCVITTSTMSGQPSDLSTRSRGNIAEHCFGNGGSDGGHQRSARGDRAGDLG